MVCRWPLESQLTAEQWQGFDATAGVNHQLEASQRQLISGFVHAEKLIAGPPVEQGERLGVLLQRLKSSDFGDRRLAAQCSGREVAPVTRQEAQGTARVLVGERHCSGHHRGFALQ